MPKATVSHRIQTTKQARAAYKARGQDGVSAAEVRQLARGAELLERAKRIRELEQRKREFRRRQEEKEVKEKPDGKAGLLGTQLRLDKFGHKSSQCHLGKFMRKQAPQDAISAIETTADPWENEIIDEDSLLEAVKTQRMPTSERRQPTSMTTPSLPPVPSRADSATSMPAGTLAGWDDFLDSSTQIARELSHERPVPQQPVEQPQWPSFSSDDAWIEEGMEDIEMAVKSAEASYCRDTSREASMTTKSDEALMPPPKMLPSRSTTRALMPPPKIVPLSIKRKPSSLPRNPCLQNRTTASHKQPTQQTSLSDITGISIADLESLAESDILLSQFPNS